jgi:hypothetical protein
VNLKKVGTDNILLQQQLLIFVGPQHRYLVIEVFSAALNWVALAHLKPSAMPSGFALPSSAIENLICRFDHHRYIWEQWIRPYMLQVGAHPPPPPLRPISLTTWDTRGLITNDHFNEWEADKDPYFNVFNKLHVQFWKINLPNLLDKTPEELSEIFGTWDKHLETMSLRERS